MNTRVLMISYKAPINSQTENASLSNLFPYEFFVDNVPCASMEGFLRSLCIKDDSPFGVTAKRLMCGYWGVNAYKIRSNLRDWRTQQTLFWDQKEIQRQSKEYQQLLTKAYDGLFDNKLFKLVLSSIPKDVILDHDGCTDPKETLLTKQEYLVQLNRLRKKL